MIKHLLKKVPFVYIWYKKLQYKKLTKENNLSQDGLLQSAPTTQLNRHPDIFEDLGARFKDQPIRILSFGCSTGEECQSLSTYLPNALIIGVDVNKKSIEKAKSKFTSERLSFYHLEAKSLHNLGKFDVITAISVLCRYPESKLIQNIESVFPFSIFEKSVGYLDQVLNSEGYLFIRSSNFRFMETEYNKKYKVISFKGQRRPEIFPKFNKNNCRLEGFEEREELFQKL